MERQQMGFFLIPGIPSMAPPAGKAVLQNTFQNKILRKSLSTRSVPVRTSYTTHHFQLKTSFPQRLHTQMADLVVISFLFLLPFLYLPTTSLLESPTITEPTPGKWRRCRKQTWKFRFHFFFKFQVIQISRMLSLAPERIWIWWNSRHAALIKCTLRHKELAD